MFETLHLAGPTRRSIRVDTRKGNPIENEISVEPGENERRKFGRLLKKHPKWIVRREPVGRYNCAGHVWASRRTSIYEDSEWRKIFEEDDYRKLSDDETPRPGDLIVYRNDESFLHVGRIIYFVAGMGKLFSTHVLSKWNDTVGEVIHDHKDVPFTDPTIEYWTDRHRP